MRMSESLGRGRRVHRDVGKAYVFKILNIMRHYYSLRDLEKMLDLPAQTIWKYVNLVAVPEEKTVIKIISKVGELRLIDKLVENSIREFRENPVAVLSKPGFLKLFSYATEDFVSGAKIDLVIPISATATILGSYVATELPSLVCPFTENPPPDKKGYIITYYNSDKETYFIALPRSCLKEKTTTLIIDVVLDEPNKLMNVVDVLSRNKIHVYGVATVDSSDSVLDLARSIGLKVMSLRRWHY
ncbi:MAG: hypothetical protein ACP5KB_04740 [Thermoprotei archaeon]